jgi:hypothetical protein
LYQGGTEAAVRAFQAAQGLGVDGCAGPRTWAALFGGSEPPRNPLTSSTIAHRCLALTACFENSIMPPECFTGVTGDFDGQGLSFGALQWNVGQNTLQPLLQAVLRRNRNACEQIFHEHLPTLEAMLAAPRAEQLRFVRALQNRRGVLAEPWRGMLKSVGRHPDCQAVQVEHAQGYLDRAVGLCAEYGLTTERGLALMFDIAVQNGSISRGVKAQILTDFKSVSESGLAAEVTKMKIIANRRAAAANPRFVEDVRRRKLTIAEGCGRVHGIDYDLQQDFGIGLVPA